MALEKKVVLITGASSGIGLQIAQRLAAEGHTVFGTSRQPGFTHSAFHALQMNVDDTESVKQAVAVILKKTERIDVLINNAGYGLYGGIEQTDVSLAKAQFETNFWGVVRTTQAVLVQMRLQGKGRIMTVGSMAGHVGLPYQAFYSASKHALEAFNESLRLELAGTGLQACIICPGDFRTDFTTARKFAATAKQHPDPGRYNKVLDIYERDENKGADPALVSALVSDLMERKKLKVRYFTGKWEQQASMLLKRFIPAAYFEKLFIGSYGLR